MTLFNDIIQAQVRFDVPLAGLEHPGTWIPNLRLYWFEVCPGSKQNSGTNDKAQQQEQLTVTQATTDSRNKAQQTDSCCQDTSVPVQWALIRSTASRAPQLFKHAGCLFNCRISGVLNRLRMTPYRIKSNGHTVTWNIEKYRNSSALITSKWLAEQALVQSSHSSIFNDDTSCNAYFSH